MDPLLTQVIQSFEANGWAFASVENADVIEAGFEAHHGRVHLHVQAFPPLNAVSVVSQSPFRADDPDSRIKIAELLMRTNHELTVGAFEMNWDTGETIFRATNIFPRGKFDSTILTGIVESTIVEMDRMMPMLSIVIQTDRQQLPALDISQLMAREDLIPETGES